MLQNWVLVVRNWWKIIRKIVWKLKVLIRLIGLLFVKSIVWIWFIRYWSFSLVWLWCRILTFALRQVFLNLIKLIFHFTLLLLSYPIRIRVILASRASLRNTISSFSNVFKKPHSHLFTKLIQRSKSISRSFFI